MLGRRPQQMNMFLPYRTTQGIMHRRQSTSFDPIDRYRTLGPINVRTHFASVQDKTPDPVNVLKRPPNWSLAWLRWWVSRPLIQRPPLAQPTTAPFKGVP